jgi:2-methylisocitrate lyase-like PEP mutase family enzyme
MPSTLEKSQAFERLHRQGCFVMPNPWDVGSARYLQHLGFEALATTSAGAAFSMGLPDGGVPLDRMLAHIADIVSGSGLPVNADFEDGHARDAAGVARNVAACIGTGVAGLSIEDFGGEKPGLYPIAQAVERVQAAREAIDKAVEHGARVLLTARAEGFIRGRPELGETIERLQAYAEAGADCLYAPGIRTREQIEAVVRAVAPKPVNVLIGGPSAFTVADLSELGVRRVSVGGALARAAWGGFASAAKRIASEGRFDGFANAMSMAELDAAFRR